MDADAGVRRREGDDVFMKVAVESRGTPGECAFGGEDVG
jgi:hypothetical protein